MLAHMIEHAPAAALCSQEYGNQLMSLANGIAICYLLNATCVLPQFYRRVPGQSAFLILQLCVY